MKFFSRAMTLFGVVLPMSLYVVSVSAKLAYSAATPTSDKDGSYARRLKDEDTEGEVATGDDEHEKPSRTDHDVEDGEEVVEGVAEEHEGQGTEAVEGGTEKEAAEEGEEAGEEGEETSSLYDIGVAVILLGSVVFVMLLFYLVNWDDDDIRLYSWQTISTTISIFTAVFLFQGLDQVINLGLEGQSDVVSCVVQFLCVVIYILLLQLTIAKLSGAICEGKDGRELLEQEKWVINDPHRKHHGLLMDDKYLPTIRNKAPGTKKTVFIDDYGLEIPIHRKKFELDRRKRRMRCFATLFAHTAGFSSIAAGGKLQHLPIFSKSPFMTFIPIGITMLFIVVLFQLSTLFKTQLKEQAQKEGRAGVRAGLFNEFTNEAENDVLSLCISFLVMQSVRYAIIGILPNGEGLEYPEKPHSLVQIWILFGVGGAALVLALVIIICESKNNQSAQNSTEVEEGAEEGTNKEEEESERNRLSFILLNALAMCAAWTVQFGTRWIIKTIPCQHNVGEMACMFHPPNMMGRVYIAAVISLLSFVMIFTFDKISDALEEEGDFVTRIISICITSLGILVGFSWEHCFDGGVEAIASLLPMPKVSKFLCAIVVAIFIGPAWSEHILSKAMTQEETQRERLQAERQTKKKEKKGREEATNGEDKCLVQADGGGSSISRESRASTGKH